MSASKKWRTKSNITGWASKADEGACKPLIGQKLTGKSETEIISSICVVWGRWGGKEKEGGGSEMRSEVTKEERKESPTHYTPV